MRVLYARCEEKMFIFKHGRMSERLWYFEDKNYSYVYPCVIKQFLNKPNFL